MIVITLSLFSEYLKTNVFQRGVHGIESEMLLYGGGRKSDKRVAKQRFWVESLMKLTSSASRKGRSCPSRRQRM